jgi:hypothetical protein
MKYWQIIYRTGQEDWETKEMIIDDNQYKLVQNALINGEDMIVIRDKPTIKRTSITSINSADKIVAEYQQQGLKIDGLLEPVSVPKITGQVKSEKDLAREVVKRNHFLVYEKNGWSHDEKCICKEWEN